MSAVEALSAAGAPPPSARAPAAIAAESQAEPFGLQLAALLGPGERGLPRVADEAADETVEEAMAGAGGHSAEALFDIPAKLGGPNAGGATIAAAEAEGSAGRAEALAAPIAAVVVEASGRATQRGGASAEQGPGGSAAPPGLSGATASETDTAPAAREGTHVSAASEHVSQNTAGETVASGKAEAASSSAGEVNAKEANAASALEKSKQSLVERQAPDGSGRQDIESESTAESRNPLDGRPSSAAASHQHEYAAAAVGQGGDQAEEDATERRGARLEPAGLQRGRDDGGTGGAAVAFEVRYVGASGQGDPAGGIERAQLVQRVAHAVAGAQPGDRVVIRLHPPELGSVRVQVAVRHDVLTAELQTETQAARVLLSESLPQLRQTLASQGLEVGRINVHAADSSGHEPWSGARAGVGSGYREPSGGQGFGEDGAPARAARWHETSARAEEVRSSAAAWWGEGGGRLDVVV